MSKIILFDNKKYELDDAKIAGIIEQLHLDFDNLVHYSEGLEFISNGDGTCSVGIGECADSIIAIPRISPDGETVTGIADDGFNGIEANNIIIPDTIISIGENAFRNGWIDTFILPENIVYIGQYAFSNFSCSTMLQIPKGLTEITPYSFAHSFAVENEEEIVEIPKGIIKIGEGAFYNNSNVKHWKIPTTLIEIGEKAFQTNHIQTKYLHIENLSSWLNVYQPSSTGWTEFEGIYVNEKLLEGDITIPEEVNIVMNGAFYGNKYITSVTLLTKNITVEENAFQRCPNLKTLYYPGTVKEFEESDIWVFGTLEQVICSDGVVEL